MRMKIKGKAVGMQTSKTLRSDRQWVKIVRDSDDRKFTFYRGNLGESRAHEEQSYPFEFVPTWAEAEKHAQERMAAYQ